MFAVPGWNLSANAPKAQTEDKSAKSLNSTKKRKRAAEGGAAPALSGQDVGKLWEQHVEGKTGKETADKIKAKVESKEASKVPFKRQKQDDVPLPDQTQAFAKRKEKHSKWNQKSVRKQKPPPPSKPEGSANGATGEEVKKKRKRGGRKKANPEEKPGEKPDEQNDGAVATVATAKAAPAAAAAAAVAAAAPPPPPAAGKLTPMQSAMRQKLVSARFRHLNQTLYTAPSDTSSKLFDDNPEMFEDYHAGFRQQVSVWPENPLDNFIRTIQERGKVKQLSQKKAFKQKGADDAAEVASRAGGLAPLPRTQGTCIIADLGCGDARLAGTLKPFAATDKLNLKLSSFDLHSPSALVTKADIANLPVAEGSTDVAIFCLALMGTNWISFIEEAYRILHWKGELWVAEIKSRFGRAGGKGKVVEHSVGSKRKQKMVGKAMEKKNKENVEAEEEEALQIDVDGVETRQQETDVTAFVDVLRRRGFVLKEGTTSIDLGNKMFVKMEFLKAATPTHGKNKPSEESKETAGETWKPKHKAKFLEQASEEIDVEEEAKVLKPCLYKIR